MSVSNQAWSRSTAALKGWRSRRAGSAAALHEPAQDEVQLDRHGLLAPQRAVVVEDRHTLLDRHRLRAVGAGRGGDERQDRLLGGAVAPARQRGRAHLIRPHGTVPSAAPMLTTPGCTTFPWSAGSDWVCES